MCFGVYFCVWITMAVLGGSFLVFVRSLKAAQCTWQCFKSIILNLTPVKGGHEEEILCGFQSGPRDKGLRDRVRSHGPSLCCVACRCMASGS